MSAWAERLGTGSRLWLRALGAAGCLAAIAFLAPRVTAGRLALVLGGLAALALVRFPHLWLPGLVAASFLVPLAVGTGTQTEVPVTLLLLAAIAALWLADKLRRRELRLAPGPANLPFAILVAVAALTTIVGDLLWNPVVQPKGNFPLVQVAQWSVFAFSALAFWIAADLAAGRRALRGLVWTFLGLGAAYVGVRLLLGYAPPQAWFLVQGSTSSLFWAFLVALPLGQALFNRRLQTPPRLALLGLVAATFYVAWFQGRDWVAGWSPPLVAAILLLWLRSPGWGALATAGLALTVQLFYPYFYTNVVLTALESGSFLRLDAWRGIVDLVGGRWPIGLGLAAYWHYWRDLIGTWTYSPANVVYNPMVSAHNNYVDLYAQMGVLGLGVFLWLALALWQQAWGLREGVGDSFERGFVYGCLGGLAGSLWSGMLADWFLPFVYNVGLRGMRSSLLMWLFLGALAGLAWRARREGEAGAA